ncbi:MAG: Ig-like domain-containing protein, partial [Elusimicrobiaceae bacterium]|nr:Ig-like domain-containing protein [Elusimicrobiaceae bacterium]
MRKPLISCLFIAALWLGPLFLQAAPLQVLSATPKGNVTVSGRQAISVAFNQPVTALSEQSSFDTKDCPLSITPAVKGACRYAGTQTLLFEPEQDWPEATQISVRLEKGFTSRVSGEKLSRPYVFSFTTRRPEVYLTFPREQEHWMTLTPVLYAAFTQPMNPQQVSGKAYLEDASGKKIFLSSRVLNPQEIQKEFSFLDTPEQALAFSPQRPLEKNTAYTWVLPAGLKSAVGPLGLAKEHKVRFVTYPDLQVLGTKHTGCLPYVPEIRFSSPVRMRELAAATTITPQSARKTVPEGMEEVLGMEQVIPPFATLKPQRRQEWLEQYALSQKEQQNGTAFFSLTLPFIDLRPGEKVTVTLDKNLQDIYGGRLGHEYTFTIDNTGYCPAVEVKDGFGVLESYLPPRFPVEVINTPSVWVEAARFNKEDYIPFLNQPSVSYCQKTPLNSPTYQGDYSFPANKNRSLRTFLDLTQFKPTAQDSIIFSQLHVKPQHRKEDCWI